MQILLLVLVVALVVGLLDAFSRACERVIGAFAAFLGGWRPDGWPRGMQEEDRDRPWGRKVTPEHDKVELPPPRPPLRRVHGAVQVR